MRQGLPPLMLDAECWVLCMSLHGASVGCNRAELVEDKFYLVGSSSNPIYGMHLTTASQQVALQGGGSAVLAPRAICHLRARITLAAG